MILIDFRVEKADSVWKVDIMICFTNLFGQSMRVDRKEIKRERKETRGKKEKEESVFRRWRP